MTFSRSFAVTEKLFAAERAFVCVTGRRQGVLDSVVAAIGANAIGIRNDIANFTYFDWVFEKRSLFYEQTTRHESSRSVPGRAQS
jgi:hypothetical protein